MAFLEVLRYSGFCEEDEYAETPDAVFYADQSSSTLDTPSGTQVVYEGSMGRGTGISRPGFYSPSGNIVCGVDIRSIGWFLKWCLGGYLYHGGKHHLYGSDLADLPSFCARCGKDRLSDGNFEHVFGGCVIDSLEIAVSDAYAMATMSINAQKDGRADIKTAAEVKAFMPVEEPMVFHEIKVNRGGDISAQVRSVTLTLSNNLNVEGGRGMGSRHPYRLHAQARGCEVSMTHYYEDLDTLRLLWGDQDGPSPGGAGETPLTITFEYVEGGKLELYFPRFQYSEVPIQPSGRDQIDVTARGIGMTEIVELPNTEEVLTEVLAVLENDEPEMILGS